MVQVSKTDFYESVKRHRLNVTYDCYWEGNTCHGKWTLGYDIVCESTHTIDHINGDKVTYLVTESFKKKYMDN